ncbi:hypothetical protein PHMEG_00016637 [Phytophthora megakarya]|uniref:Uncharacterized protein n=1 Tax=Phytophthora megakarya TaxID=4795 RepID=A0A225W0E1_9STRA|nr:hypothetical protein PHMEG_00016637 [Phytophthora megakarya]
MLSVPFNGHERVALIQPDTLGIVLVRRQHIIDCELPGNSPNPADIFKDPTPADDVNLQSMRPHSSSKRRSTNNVDLTFIDTDNEGKGELPSTAQEDIDLIRLQNRPLRKRARLTEFDLSDVLLGDEDVPVVGTRAEPLAAVFRPSQVEQDVHNAVAHASLHGKQDQLVLESAQQGPRTKFLATPPVLRGAYDISFGIRGLSLMHFRRFFDEVEMYNAVEVVNMVDFGRSNTLQPAVPASSIDEIVDAFNTLLYFAKDFFNPTVYDFIKAGADFIETYAAFSRPDSETCRMLVHWINSKLGKFHATVITSGLSSAVPIGKEFTRSDDHPMELYQSQTDRRAAATSPVTPGRPQTITRQQQNREHCGVKTSSAPKELLEGNKSMCMRFISKKGCIGPTPGKCFDPNRAHFKPTALPAAAKSWIERHFHDQQSQDRHMSPEYNAFCRQRLHQYNRFTQSKLAISRRLLALRHDQYRELASSHAIVIPHEQAQTGSQLDISRIRADSQLAQRLNTSLAAFVRIYRSETTDDPPVRQSIVKGRLDGRYIVVEADLLDQWTNSFVSPIGVAEKPGPPVDIRAIYDYSFPNGEARSKKLRLIGLDRRLRSGTGLEESTATCLTARQIWCEVHEADQRYQPRPRLDLHRRSKGTPRSRAEDRILKD